MNRKAFDLPFYFLLLYLLFDYARPQTFIPGLASLRLGMILQLILLAALIFRNRILRFDTKQTKLFVCFLALMALHVPIALNNYFAFQVWRSMSLYFIAYMSIVNFVDSQPKIEKYIQFWILINIAAAAVGFINSGHIPNSSFMGDENDFALVMNMAIPFAYFSAMQAESGKLKTFYLLAVGVLIAANVASVSRGGFLGLIIVLGYCWYRTLKNNFILVFAAAAIAVLIFIYVAPRFARYGNDYWSQMQTIKEDNVTRGTGAARWYFWKVGMRMFMDHPVWGVGQGNYPWNLDSRYEDPGGFGGKFSRGRVAHSMYVTLLSELGIVGAIIVASMIFTCMKDLLFILRLERNPSFRRIQPYLSKEFMRQLKSMQFIAHGIVGAYAGFLVSGSFLSVLYYPHLWYLFALSVACRKILERNLRESAMRVPVSQAQRGLSPLPARAAGGMVGG